MRIKIQSLLILLFLFYAFGVRAQQINYAKENTFDYKELIIPTVFIGYGVLALNNSEVKNWDYDIQNRFSDNKPLRFDDYLQYAPMAMPFALSLSGVKGRHSLKEQAVIFVTALATTGISVKATKLLVKRQRPNNTDNHSFPSGHTAKAFMGAEFLYQEYKDNSIWYGIGGYAVASLVAYGRIYNNEHWLSDIVIGVGMGILSTKISYWLFPTLKKIIFKNDDNKLLLPYWNNNNYGINFVINF